MMTRLLLSIVIASSFAMPNAFAGNANQQSGVYASVSTGLGIVANSNITPGGITINNLITYKSGVPFIGAVGFKSDAYRLEAAFEYQSNNVDKEKLDGVNLTSVLGNSVSISSYMANYYYDINVTDDIAPYLTAGLGSATITTKSTGFPDESQRGFAYQLGAGIGINALKNIVIDFGYRYFKPSAKNVLNIANVSTQSNNFLVGLRYNF